jgi:quercetin dioxygenase-like cupin family protein
MRKLFSAALLCIGLSCNLDNKTSVGNKDNVASKNSGVHHINRDALTASPENFKLLLENEYVRVLEYTLNPGQKDHWHTHPPKSSYVVSGGQLKIYLENDSSFIATDTAGTASWMDYVGKHYVENIGTTPVKVILTEIKSLQQQD